MRYVVLGTNTGVGKTIFSALFVKYLRLKRRKVLYVKAVQTGYPKENDALVVNRIAGLAQEEAITILKADKPVAPAVFFDEFPVDVLRDTVLNADGYEDVVIESSGGLCTPLSRGMLSYNLVEILEAEAILVLPNRLGCISDGVVSYSFLRFKGIDPVFMAINDYFPHSEDQRNIELINEFCHGKLRVRFDSNVTFI